jgi:hypothetical protein
MCRFWQLVHTTPSTPEAFWRAITLSKSRRAGFVYVTNDAGANPWCAPHTNTLTCLERYFIGVR